VNCAGVGDVSEIDTPAVTSKHAFMFDQLLRRSAVSATRARA
jgi:hypothetical protein